MSDEKKQKENTQNLEQKSIFNKEQAIIETTYEKVLSIINKVKEFIKKTSSETNTLIEDLEWVIKVITNKSLYTYELKQEKLSKQNEEYNKFISFVTKYNEEVLEMNKKHDIVSGILSIGKKGELLLKPSLCLKKILPGEFKNLNEQTIKGKKIKHNNFIYVFGNTILNLYNKEMERRKKNFENIKLIGNIDKSYNKSNEEKKEIKPNDQIIDNKNENNTTNNNETDKTDKNYTTTINNEDNNKPQLLNLKQKLEKSFEKENKYDITNFKNIDENYKESKDNLFNENKLKQNNISIDKNNINVNIQKIRIVREKEKLETKLKFKNYIKSNTKSLNNLTKNKNKGATKLIKNEKITFNNIKKAMKNYFIKFAFNENQGANMQIYELKGNFNNNRNLYRTNYNYNNNINLNEIKKKNKRNMENDFLSLKNYKYGSYHNNLLTKSKRKNNIYNKQNEDFFKDYKIVKNLKDNLAFDSNEDIYYNPNYISINNNMANKGVQLSKRFQITAENKSENLFSKENSSYTLGKVKTPNKYNYSQKNNKSKNNDEKNKNQNKEENKNNNYEKVKESHKINPNINSLVDKNMEDAKMITEIDFHIFNFKDKVGYRNVLPIMGYVILKSLGLLDSKIISTKKLDSFLYTVSDNYKITTLYHNSLHGADVTQSLCVYFLNSNAEEIGETTVLDLLSMIISAMGHDLGHPGLNNNFLINSGHELAITYNDASCLENYHTSYLFKILRNEDNNILEKLSVQNYKTIRKRMISQILATDMANHGETISLIRSKIKAWQDEGQSRFNLLTGNEKTKFGEQQLLLNYMIHMADLGHNCKKFEISIIWIKILCEEFWLQGDKEKAKGLPISFMCDRDNIDVPASQIGFLRGFILSSFDCLVSMFPKLKYNIENAENNIKNWKKMQDEKRLLGWTPKKEKENEKTKDEQKDCKNDDNKNDKKESIKVDNKDEQKLSKRDENKNEKEECNKVDNKE